jgi:hypothetical protein
VDDVVGRVFPLALLAALNPTLLAASALMMLLPRPVRLMLGYLAGAMMTSISLGLVIVFGLEGSELLVVARETLAPAASIALGAIALVAASVLKRVAQDRAAARSRARDEVTTHKEPPKWQRLLSKGSARGTFVVGALLTLPGASYLAGLSRIDALNYSTAKTVLMVIAFNVIMLAVLEVALICFLIAPERTPRAIEGAKAWIGRRGPQFAVRALVVLGVLLVTKGVIELLI